MLLESMGRTAIIYIAERCNQECVFCLEVDKAWAPFVDPSTTQVKQIIDELRSRGAEHITFMGGETFFRKDLGMIIAHAKSAGISRLGVTTNGTVLAKKGFLRGLVDAGLDFIELSIHGHTPELANAIGGTGFTFERQAAAMAEIEEIGSLLTIVNVVVCDENKGNLVDIARYVCEAHPGIPARFKFKFVSLQGLAAEDAASGRRRLRYGDVDAIEVGDYLAARGVPFWYYNIPLCHLGPHAKRAHEVATLSADERYFDFDHAEAARYFDSEDQLAGRIWPEATCRDCSVASVCPGVELLYHQALGSSELAPRRDDPRPMVEFALDDRGLDVATAAARLEKLRQVKRPSRIEDAGGPGVLRFHKPGTRAIVDLVVAEAGGGEHVFATTARFSLAHRPWREGDPLAQPDVVALLERAADELRAVDAAGAPLEAARAAVGAIEHAGWTTRRDEAPSDARPPATAPKRAADVLYFRHPADREPVELVVEDRAPEARAFALSPRFALSYRRWRDSDPLDGRPHVATLLERAKRAMTDADASGASLEVARAAVGRAADEGWSLVTAQPAAPPPTAAPRGPLRLPIAP